MTLLVLFILAVIWAAVLLPPYLQNRSESRPADSISSFQHQLSVLERRANPRSVGYAPVGTRMGSGRPTRSEVRKRRRDVLFTLAGAAGFSFVLAVLLGGPVWGLNIVCDLLLGAYVLLLIQLQQRAVEQQQKVRPLPMRPARPVEPALLLRRSGS